MAKIKKRGLDYFPINTDFLQSRLMRRIMKREGDVAPTVLLQVFSAIYAGEGYYVTADSLFYDDLADCFYRLEPEDVERIIALAVEYGLFDAALFQQYGILTAADIQQQFLFSKKRHTIESIDPRYCLLPAEGEEEEEEGEAEAETVQCSAPKRVSKSKKSVTKSKKSVTFSTENVTFRPKNDEKAPFGTHSIEQNSKEQQSTAEQSKENPSSKSPPKPGATSLRKGEGRSLRKGGRKIFREALKARERMREQSLPKHPLPDQLLPKRFPPKQPVQGNPSRPSPVVPLPASGPLPTSTACTPC